MSIIPMGIFSVIYYQTSKMLLQKWIAIILTLFPPLAFGEGWNGRGTESF